MARHKQAEREEIQRQTRQKLLDAATQAFAKHGYTGANINRISLAAGFAKGTVYNYFESKRALMLALIEDFSTAHYEFIAEQVLQESEATRRVVRFFEAGYAFVESHLSQGWVMVNNIYGSDPEFKEVMYRSYEPMFGLVAQEVITLGLSQGVFRPVDPASTAGLVMNIYLGVASQFNNEGRPWISAGMVTDFVLNALYKKDRIEE